MKYFHLYVDNPEIHLYPLVCWHIGAKQSCGKLIQNVIRAVQEDPFGFAIYMGDGGECVTKASKGNIYEQLLNPGDQLRVAANLLKEIGPKLIGGIRGNHGNRIDRETGVGWDEMLCERVGIPYWGVSAFGNITLQLDPHHTQAFSLYVHHGNSGSISPGGKMAAAHRPAETVWADLALTAHTHACGEAWPARHVAFADARANRIVWKTMRMFVCGSAYDSRSGYAEEKQYPPVLPQHLMIEVTGRRDNPIDVNHTTINGFGDDHVSKSNRLKWRLHE